MPSENSQTNQNVTSGLQRLRIQLFLIAIVAVIAWLRPYLQSVTDSASPPSVEATQVATVEKSAGSTLQPAAEATQAATPAEAQPAKAPPGKLSLIRGTRDQFRSTAGLLYLPGSADGHRLKHVLKHARDDLDKPIHGVFDGTRDEILGWIDITYMRGRKGERDTKKETQRGRVVYTADLKKKIGFVGGQVGQRRGKPPCNFLKLVLQNGNEVVTAYPTDSL